MPGNEPRVSLDPTRLEGVLLAHRRILALLLARHADAALLEELDSRSLLRDHQEDPGAVPSDGLAILAHEAGEFRLIAERVRSLMAARPDSDG